MSVTSPVHCHHSPLQSVCVTSPQSVIMSPPAKHLCHLLLHSVCVTVPCTVSVITSPAVSVTSPEHCYHLPLQQCHLPLLTVCHHLPSSSCTVSVILPPTMSASPPPDQCLSSSLHA